MNAKEKFQQISIAYTKLIAGNAEFYDDIDLESDDGRPEEGHEMRAFMHMFMDLVGVFQDDAEKNAMVKPRAAVNGMSGLLYVLSVCIYVTRISL